MNKSIPTIVLIVLATCLSGIADTQKEMNPPKQPEPVVTTALVGGRLIDGNGGPPVDDAVVLVRGGSIIAAGTKSSLPIPEDAIVVDTSGKSILPGLIDTHFHSKDTLKTPVEYELHNGITSFRDPGHPFRYYDTLLNAGIVAPRVFLCGAHLDAAPPVWPDQAIVIRDEEHARHTVDQHVDLGASAIKVYFRLPLNHIRAACEAARNRNVLVTAHLELVDADQAIDAGIRGIEHITSFGTALASPQRAAQFKQVVHDNSAARREWRHRLWASIDLEDNPRAAALLTAIVANEVFVSPTLAIFERREVDPDATAEEVAGFRNMMEFTRMCHTADVKLVVGSHTSAPHAAKGKAYQREVELLVEAGMSPAEVITAATRHGAEFLGIADRLGTIEPGKEADLLIVRGDPLQDIAHLNDVDRVMLAGGWVVP